jgi:hypothetical protein
MTPPFMAGSNQCWVGILLLAEYWIGYIYIYIYINDHQDWTGCVYTYIHIYKITRFYLKTWPRLLTWAFQEVGTRPHLITKTFIILNICNRTQTNRYNSKGHLPKLNVYPFNMTYTLLA